MDVTDVNPQATAAEARDDGAEVLLEAGPEQAGPEQTGPADVVKVALITLGCARNEVDSQELAGRLAADGFELVDEPEQADTVMVNTCGFIDAAKKDSVDTLLAAADLKETGTPRAVVAVGCMAERYGVELADALPEADAVLSFDDYPVIAERLRAIIAGDRPESHVPRDRRTLLPLTPVQRDPSTISVPGISPAPDAPRRRLSHGPMEMLKLASGCDRRCTFCAIPSFRGAFVSRRPADVLADVRAMAADGVREVVLVSENSTSYGKDLGDLRLLEGLLPELGAVPGLEWVRVSYLQPAEMRPGLISAVARTPGVAPYFDLSFQHASRAVLRRMRRYGDGAAFLDLIDRIRAEAPQAGLRSNFIIGFPGETEQELAELAEFLSASRLDAIGVFGYSDEDGTEAASLPGHLDPAEVAARVDSIASLADAVMADAAEARIGHLGRMLVESVAADGSGAEGRCAHQGPEDATTTLRPTTAIDVSVGDVLDVRFIDSEGADLIAEVAR